MGRSQTESQITPPIPHPSPVDFLLYRILRISMDGSRYLWHNRFNRAVGYFARNKARWLQLRCNYGPVLVCLVRYTSASCGSTLWRSPLLACLILTQRSAVAQFDGGGGGGGNTIGGGATSGVAVDADGVLRRVMVADPTGELSRQRVQEALTRLDRDVAKRSPLRKVSLTRLERIIKQRLAEGRPIDDAMQHLAGITRLQYVFCYPESGDVVIAGPAEAWAEAPAGRMLGIESGRPVLELQDLVVALRAFPPGADSKKPFIYCSIDPTPEGLSRMQQFLHEFGRIGDHAESETGTIHRQPAARPARHAGDHRRRRFAEDALRPGHGRSRLSHEADRHRPGSAARAADELRRAGEPVAGCPQRAAALVLRARLSMRPRERRCAGDGAGGRRREARRRKRSRRQGRQAASLPAGGNRASDAFVNAFTKVYPKLAERAPVYAQLRNCIDLAVAAAFIQNQDYYGLVNWKPDVFHSEQAYPVETLNPPKQVESAVNACGRATRW